MKTRFSRCRPSITALVLVVAGSRPAAQPIYDDLLTRSDPQALPHRAAAVVGGCFVAEGWQSIKSSDQLYYVLPADLTAATVEFEVKGIRIGLPPARQHIVGVYSLRKAGAQDIKSAGTDLDGLKIGATVKLNVRNLADRARLIPTSAWPDGTRKTFRIAAPQQFILTTIFEL